VYTGLLTLFPHWAVLQIYAEGQAMTLEQAVTDALE
jgi:hypothetical protein